MTDTEKPEQYQQQVANEEVNLIKEENIPITLKEESITPLKQEERKKRKLTIKQRKWLKLYIKLGNATEAAKLVYKCTDNSAKTIGSENLSKLNYQELMEDMGISDQKLLSVLDDGLTSYQVDRSGKVRKDFSTIHKYLETGLKLKKRLDNKQEQQANNLIGLSIVVNNK